jgi:peptidyl-prolyl cis-trans isomerase C
MKFPIIKVVRRWPAIMPRGRAALAVVIASALVFAGAATQTTISWATALPAGAVFRVGGTVISKDEFQQRINVLKALYGVQPPQGGTALTQFDKDAAKSIAVGMIVRRAAQDKNIVIADKTAQDALTKLINDQMPQGQQAFTQFLGSQGISQNDVLDEVKRQLETSQLFDAITGNTPAVTDDDVKKAFQDRQAQMVTPEKRHLRNIVVATQDQANQLLAQAQGGADFTKLASASSLDASTKNAGGDLGTLTADQLDPAFAKAAFAAGPNSVFGPVNTQYGWNVGQVVGIDPATPLSYDQAKAQLKTDLGNERKLAAWRTWLAGQIKSADVQYAKEYRPDDPDAAPSDTPGAPAH